MYSIIRIMLINDDDEAVFLKNLINEITES